MDTPIQSNRTTRCNSLSSAPNRSCGSRCVPIAFDTPTSDSYRVAAESRDPSVTSSVRIQQTLRDCRLKRWMSQILGTLQTEKRSPSTSELCNRSGRAVREDEHVVTRAEFHGTLKMRFVHFPVRFRTLGFKNSGRTTPPSVHIRMLREFLSCCDAESSGSRHNDQICATLVNSHLRNLITICRSGGSEELGIGK